MRQIGLTHSPILAERIAEKTGIAKEKINHLLGGMKEDECVNIFESSFSQVGPEWVSCSRQSLLAIRPIIHSDWELQIYCDSQELERACADADSGVTFAFYWREGRLCWER